MANNVNFEELLRIVDKAFRTNDFKLDEVLVVGKDGELKRIK